MGEQGVTEQGGLDHSTQDIGVGRYESQVLHDSI